MDKPPKSWNLNFILIKTEDDIELAKKDKAAGKRQNIVYDSEDKGRPLTDDSVEEEDDGSGDHDSEDDLDMSDLDDSSLDSGNGREDDSEGSKEGDATFLCWVKPSERRLCTTSLTGRLRRAGNGVKGQNCGLFVGSCKRQPNEKENLRMKACNFGISINREQGLLTIILPIIKGDYQLEKKLKLLNNYIKSLEAFQKDAKENATRFLQLKQHVDAFRINLKQTVSDQPTLVEAKIKVIDEKIARLQADLDATSGFFAGCWEVLKLAGPNLANLAGATLGAAGTVGTIAATAGLAAMAPVAGVGILPDGWPRGSWLLYLWWCQRLSKPEGRYAKMNKITDLKEKREEKALQLQQLKEVMEELRELDVVFDRMSIWRMLITDLQRLHLSLSDLSKADLTDIAFKVISRQVQVMYKALQLSLDQYCLAVTDTGLKKK
ncbi:hypothetical protein B0H34DRAFT_675599 [Crassisporium funariophilum]|nr:hypothetical protein B0H34DRAFT_675599 [Crassisporium funariophilum]